MITNICSIYSDTPIVQEKLLQFRHPLVDTTRTRVVADVGSLQSSLEIQLYDTKGNYLIEDQPLCGEIGFPGLLLTLQPREQKMCIESIYVKPMYRGEGLGRDFVEHLCRVARGIHYKKIALVADEKTNALGYWKNVHGFYAPDLEKPLVLEKRVHADIN